MKRKILISSLLLLIISCGIQANWKSNLCRKGCQKLQAKWQQERCLESCKDLK